MNLSQPKVPAVFLDRDGTINVEKKYLHRVEDFEFIPGAQQAIRRLRDAGYMTIVVTNQSGVARGYYGLAEVDRLHQHLQQELARCNTRIDAFYVCPHHPEQGTGKFVQDCNCRKGAPGMLLKAAADYNIDLSRSFMVGDKIADVEAGRRAGCASILVLTGHGQNEFQSIKEDAPKVCQDLVEAADEILSIQGKVDTSGT